MLTVDVKQQLNSTQPTAWTMDSCPFIVQTSRASRHWKVPSTIARPDQPLSLLSKRSSLCEWIAKLENCVCKTQVMPPCPKPVLTPCLILTHDPQHIQSILETNVWNVKVKIAAILSKIIFLCAKKKKEKKQNKTKKKTHAHLQCAFNSCAKFQNECLKTLSGVDYTILLPLTET